MKLKSKWIYNYKKGLRDLMISNDYHLTANKLYFSLTFGSSSFNSILLELDLETHNARTIFEENHVVRTAGIHENGKIYLTTFKGIAYCLDMSGNICWSTNLNLDNASFKMALDGDRFYASDHGIFCLNKNTGEIIWKNESFNQKSNCNILYDDKFIYCGESGGHVFCLDKFSGEVRWSYGNEEWISSCVIIDNNRLLVSHIHGKFYIFNSQNGELLCTNKANGYLYKTPVFEGSKMYIGDSDSVIDSKSGNMTCYELISNNKLKEIFRVTVGGGISTDAVISDEKLFFAAEDNYLYCIDKNSGEFLAKKKTKGICRNIIVRDNELILLSDKGQAECFEIV